VNYLVSFHGSGKNYGAVNYELTDIMRQRLVRWTIGQQLKNMLEIRENVLRMNSCASS